MCILDTLGSQRRASDSPGRRVTSGCKQHHNTAWVVDIEHRSF